MTVVNAGPLPVRHVRGLLYDARREEAVGVFVPLPVVRTGEATATLQIPESLRLLRLVLMFDDDNGVTWRKYGRNPLERVDSPPALDSTIYTSTETGPTKSS